MTAADDAVRESESEFLDAVIRLRAEHGKLNPLSDGQRAGNIAVARTLARRYGDASPGADALSYVIMYSIAEQTDGLTDAEGFAKRYLSLVKTYFPEG